jgi:predicted dehydrogenase
MMAERAARLLGIGVAGCGNVAHGAHLPNIVQHPRAKVVAAADIDLDRANAPAAHNVTSVDGD